MNFIVKRQEGQIVYKGHTSEWVWERLEQKSTQTRLKVEHRCPECSGEIQGINQTTLRCDTCQTDIEVFQRRDAASKKETRFIYFQTLRSATQILRVGMRCLSCEDYTSPAGDCTGSCEIQTYLIIAPEDGEIYVKRWINHPHLPRESTEIPMHETIQQRNVSSVHQNVNQPNSCYSYFSGGGTIDEQIVAFLELDPHIDRGERSAGEIIEAVDGHPASIKKALAKLVKKVRIEKVRHGYYKVIPSDHSVTS